VLAGAIGSGAQVIFASSGRAGYGECRGPVDEDFPFLPLSPYGIAKKCGEEYLAGWNRIHGTSHVALRFGNVYGPRQDAGLEGGVVSIFLERMANRSVLDCARAARDLGWRAEVPQDEGLRRTWAWMQE
jgi:UDP-glucose 4-epimerase